MLNGAYPHPVLFNGGSPGGVNHVVGNGLNGWHPLKVGSLKDIPGILFGGTHGKLHIYAGVEPFPFE